MTNARIVSIGIGLLLSGSLLTACGGEAPQTETAPSTSESTTSTAAEAPADEDTPPETPETATSVGTGTAINPPQAATLTAQQANAQINLRSQPTTESASEGYGLVDDPVKLLRATEGDGGLTWYYVKFDQSGAEGWIRGDFIDTRDRPARASSGSPVSIDAFTTDELFGMGSGGCGMTLWPVNSPDEYIFFNGLPDTSMWMKLDGTMTEFRRTAASGREFYGQSATQTFVSNDGNIEVDVTASVGSEEGYESVNIQRGTLVLEGPAGRTTEVVVAGDAGC